MKGQNTLIKQKTINLLSKKTVAECKEVTNIDTPVKRFDSDSEGEDIAEDDLSLESFNSSSLDPELHAFNQESPLEHKNRVEAYRNSKVKIKGENEKGFELRQIEYNFKHQNENE